MRKCFFTRLFFLFTSVCAYYDDDPWKSPLEITDVRNDAVTIHWQMPEDKENRTTWQRAMINVIRTSVPLTKTSLSANLTAEARSYTFTGLSGNTTYRASIEFFEGDLSLWYASNMATTSLASLHWLGAPTDLSLIAKTDNSLEIVWSTPEVMDPSLSAVISQFLVNIYEFVPRTRQSFKKASLNVPVPKLSYIIEKLTPSSVYNITIQGGTSYGYGNIAWSVYSTLSYPDEEYVLRHKGRTPNSILLTWPPKWLPNPNSKFLIWAKTLHSADNVDKEITINGQGEQGKPAEFLLRNLHPGSTYNVSITTSISSDKSKTTVPKWMAVSTTKTAWSVFSTLTQGEYIVGQPRLVVETDSAASFVFQPLKQLGDVAYQIRYTVNDGSKAIETVAYTENELRCPQFGCDWLCALVFNLPRRPRDYSFEIRAKVDDIWNKWTSIARRPWNLLERVCSINPPMSYVENIGSVAHQRIIEMPYNPPIMEREEPWRYLIVVDSRQSDYSAIDISKLTDKATADIDRIPYYVTGSLQAEDLRRRVEFRIGDGVVRGGYLNYPLKDSTFDPHWTLVPISQSENEIMDPNLKSCGFSQDGAFECDMTFWELTSHVPMWITTSVFLLSIFCLLLCCLLGFCWLRSVFAKPNQGTKESNVLYYHSDSPNTFSTTSAYRRVEQREYHPSELEERIGFIEN